MNYLEHELRKFFTDKNITISDISPSGEITAMLNLYPDEFKINIKRIEMHQDIYIHVSIYMLNLVIVNTFEPYDDTSVKTFIDEQLEFYLKLKKLKDIEDGIKNYSIKCVEMVKDTDSILIYPNTRNIVFSKKINLILSNYEDSIDILFLFKRLGFGIVNVVKN